MNLKELLTDELLTKFYFDTTEGNVDRLLNDLKTCFPHIENEIGDCDISDFLDELGWIVGDEIDVLATKFKGLVNIPINLLSEIQGKIMYNPEYIKHFEIVENTDSGCCAHRFSIKIKFLLEDNVEVGTHLFAGIDNGGDYGATEMSSIKIINGQGCLDQYEYLILHNDPKVIVVRLKSELKDPNKYLTIKFDMIRCADN